MKNDEIDGEKGIKNNNREKLLHIHRNLPHQGTQAPKCTCLINIKK